MQSNGVNEEPAKVTKEKFSVNARTVLYYLVFTGITTSYLYRININIAIVDMVLHKNSIQMPNTSINECYNKSMNAVIDQSANSTQTMTTEILHDSTRFEWDEYDQSIILGSYYWLSGFCGIPGAILSRKYGTKMVFGISNLVGCFLCFLIPTVANWNKSFVIAIRILQGLTGGIAFPSMHNLMSQWIPPNERSKFLSSYQGNSASMAIFYPLFGFVMVSLSWKWVFYLSGLIGTVWYLFWLYFVYDTPGQHPRIDPFERDFIENSLGNTIQKRKKAIPWISILTSKTVLVIILAHFGILWSLLTMTVQAPTYFKNIHGFDTRMTGILSGIPNLIRILSSFIFGYIADYLLRKELMSRTNVRKSAATLTLAVNGIFFIGLAFAGCNSTQAIVFLILGTIVQSAAPAGISASMVDVSPNYSSILMALSILIGTTSGYISPYIVGLLTYQNQTATQWKYIYLITAGILIAVGIPFLCLFEAKVQSWNEPEDSKDVELENLEQMPINANNKQQN